MIHTDDPGTAILTLLITLGPCGQLNYDILGKWTIMERLNEVKVAKLKLRRWSSEVKINYTKEKSLTQESIIQPPREYSV